MSKPKKKRAAIIRLDPDLVWPLLVGAGGSAGAVAKALSVHPSTVRNVLVRLEAAGKVKRTGSCKGTRWGIVENSP